MHLGHHRRDPAHVEIAAALARFAVLALRDVAVHGDFPEPRVAGVDREFAGVFGNAQVGVRQDEVADFAIEREAVRALADRDDQHRRRAVDRVTRGHLLDALLQEVLDLRRFLLVVTQDREDRADRHVDVGVRRTVERIEDQQEAAARILGRDRVRIVELFGRHARDQTAPVAALQDHVVRGDVELDLLLALHVLRAGLAEETAERALRRHRRDGLDRRGDVDEQRAQVARALDAFELLDQELGECRAAEMHGRALSLIVSCLVSLLRRGRTRGSRGCRATRSC